MSRPVQEAGLFVHGKIHEVEGENVGVEGGHKGEELAEQQAGKAIRSGIRRHKLKPYRAAAKAERKSIAANAEYIYQKSLRDNPELAQAVSNPVSRFWQKQKIKRDYAKAARAAGQTAQGAAGAATKTAQASAAAAKKAAKESKKGASFLVRHWKGALLIGGVGLMLMLIMGGLQSCTAMFGSAGTGLAATSYLSEDDDMLGAEAAYADLEADLQHELDNYESLHPGYDEYRFDLDDISHDPYVLTSILSALHGGAYTLDEVQGDLDRLFGMQYTLTQTIETETRYRMETSTDPETGEEIRTTFSVPEKRIVSFNPALAKKQKAEIMKMADRASNYTTYKKMTREELGDAVKYVKVTNKDRDGKKVTPIMETDQDRIQEDLKYAGYNLMVTSELDMDPLQVYQTYHSLWRIEEAFRITKSYLDARPVYVQKRETIYGHFLICYLTLFLLRVLEIKVFKNAVSSYDLLRFMRDFRGVRNREDTYTNISRDQAVNEKIREFNRITVGTREQMDALLGAVADILEEKKYENR